MVGGEGGTLGKAAEALAIVAVCRSVASSVKSLVNVNLMHRIRAWVGPAGYEVGEVGRYVDVEVPEEFADD